MPAKTYAQQVQDLKSEKQTNLDRIAQLQEQLSLLPELHEELESVRAQLAAKSKEGNQGTTSLQTRLTDANQRADSEAARARRLSDENTRLAHINGQLKNQIEKFADVQKVLDSKDKKIEAFAGELSAANVTIAQTTQRAKDAIAQARSESDAISDELRNLRMNQKGYQNLIIEQNDAHLKTVTELTEKIDSLKSENEAVIQHFEKAYQDLLIERNEVYKTATTALQKKIDSLKSENESLVQQFEKAKFVIRGYKKKVDEIPDTRSQLLAILNAASTDGPSTE